MEMMEQKPEKWYGVRHIHYIFFFTALFISNLNTGAFTVAILAMIDDESVNKNNPTYPDWSPHKNVMLSSYFWGFIATQLISAQLAERFGPKWILAGSIFIGHLFVILVPSFGDKLGYQGVIACRVIAGLTFGFISPCLYNLLIHWTNIDDRAKACGIMYAGYPFGDVFATLTTGLICKNPKFGWTAVYYIFGAFGIIWTILWILLGANSPSKHKNISLLEKEYITRGAELIKENEINLKKLPTPWISIMTSLPNWAILINDCGFAWGTGIILTELPSFMQYILKFDIAMVGLLTSLPSLVHWLLTIGFGYIADYLNERKVISLITNRRIFNSIAMFVPAIALITLSFVPSTERVITVALFVVIFACFSGIYSGYTVNRMDLSPNYAATLLGISNTLSNSFSLLGPLSLDIISDSSGYKETNKRLWNITFCMVAGVFILIGTFYNFTSSADVQPWNNPGFKKKNSKIKENL